MLSFSVSINVLFLILSVAVLPWRACGAPTNSTFRLNSTEAVSFTRGWSVATFAEDGSQFAFANGLQDDVQVKLPTNSTAVFYQGFRIARGALYFACVDCGVPNTTQRLANIDAHDSTENGTQPPETLFSFTDLDPTQQHILSVVNLPDPRFNNTSQLTFDSVIVTTDPEGGDPMLSS
ncbi:hypothetical protein C8Q78DRAFT_166294 [Trametes maxima]|nr:hypothetical protein C8Q78DRAFT_166294 [Trametes maxima]